MELPKLPRLSQRVIFLSLLGVLALCMSTQASADDAITFGAPPWPGITAKTEVATQILETLGYQTDVTHASTTVLLVGIRKGQIDAMLGVWMPSQAAILKPFTEDGSAVTLAKNMIDLPYGGAVPQYVCNAGVTSLADLAAHAKRFGKKIYGIEPGDAGNLITKKAIKNDTYGLAGWQLVPSSTAGMLAIVGKAIKHHEWIVFHGWKPHWMNIKYNICYLKDPKNIWGGNSNVLTVARAGLVDAKPNVTRFLSQMVVPDKAQSGWTLDFSFKKKPLDQVVHKWIAEHPEVVSTWVKGVTTKDGDEAASIALAEAFGWSSTK